MTSVDDSKVFYYSGWDIDQLRLLPSNTLVVPIGDTVLFDITSATVGPGQPAVPVYEVQFQPTGSSMWYQAGAYSTTGLAANSSSFYTYIQVTSSPAAGHVHISTLKTGTARWFIWTDKVTNI